MNKLSLTICQAKLITLWGVASVGLIIWMFLQIMFSHFDGQERDAWDWLLAKIGPNFTLMLGAIIQTAADSDADKKTVRPLIYKLALWVIILYFAAIYAVLIFGYRFGSFATMQNCSIVLTSLQGIISTLLGVFFVSAKQDKAADKTE